MNWAGRGRDPATGRANIRSDPCQNSATSHPGRAGPATGTAASSVIPAAIDRESVDPLLGTAVETTPVAVATDGGQVHATDATDDGTHERPTDCGCWGQNDLPCFSCWMAGFETPNPDADE